MAKSDRNRQKALRSFLDFCERVGFAPEPFQKKVASAFFGPEREFVASLPRGNGKSHLVAALAMHHLTTTPNARVYVAAASREQASVVHEYAAEIARELDLDVNQREIRTEDGYLRIVASDAGKLQGLSPTLVVVDELHAHKDAGVYLAMRTSLLKRPGAKMAVISTAGQGASSPLGQLRARALAQQDVKRRGAVVDARGPDIRYLEWSVADDRDPSDLRAVKAANPGSWLTRKGLREQRNALPELAWRRFHCNQWTAKMGSWLPAGAWQACAAEYEVEPGEEIWAGVDVGGSRADSAVVWVTEDLRVGCEIFSGEDAILDVRDLVPELAERYDLAAVACDPWRTGQMMREWEDRGGFEVLEFPQHDGLMIPASERLHDAIVNGELRHPDDERLNQHVAAAVARHSRRGWRLDKPERSEKIDGCVALAMALNIAERPKPKPTEFLGVL